jgi:hypothetical protein
MNLAAGWSFQSVRSMAAFAGAAVSAGALPPRSKALQHSATHSLQIALQHLPITCSQHGLQHSPPISWQHVFSTLSKFSPFWISIFRCSVAASEVHMYLNTLPLKQHRPRFTSCLTSSAASPSALIWYARALHRQRWKLQITRQIARTSKRSSNGFGANCRGSLSYSYCTTYGCIASTV